MKNIKIREDRDRGDKQKLRYNLSEYIGKCEK